MATVNECAKLSNAAYNGSIPTGWQKENLDGVVGHTGFQAVLYQNATTGEYVLAIAGTDSPLDADDGANIAAGWKPDQFDDALNLYEEMLKNEKYASANISITGHSLGGACAAYIVSQYF